MSLEKYAHDCAILATEMWRLLTADEYADVPDALSTFGVNEWYRWRREHHKEVSVFASATPSRQKKMLLKHDREKRLLLVFASVQMGIETAELLYAVLEKCQEGLSYRNMIRAAAEARREIENRESSFWPLEGHPTFRDLKKPSQ
ncbi:MAG: hypothetical protein G3M70_07105 [Candidatus Nitronauta litoralis]|uniref:Uncharacterized protein n=1 Tax=Candidatus Nitronauta litoralis TaxID=2705533 RepID=A0A7T0BVC8_9BACT|nr:MAG: hypothetical protein G3M70_07105 [Candidatus Nitronauta litoralis]